MICLLFEHTGQGEKALAEFVEAGVPHDAVAVVGDLGEAGAERHVTLDRLGVPHDLRGLFMDTVREGGVVLGVDAGVVSEEEIQRVGERCGVVRVVVGMVGVESHNRLV